MTDATTIEVMLSPQQMKVLATAHEGDAMQHLKSRIFIGGGMAVALIVSGAVVANLAAKPKPAPAPVLHASQPLPPPAPAAEPAAPAAEPVLYKNPFDRTEVFEFPAGTTHQEARDAVAKLLMDRAHGRGPDVLKLKIRRIHAAKPLTATTAPRSDRSNLQASSSVQTASPPADRH